MPPPPDSDVVYEWRGEFDNAEVNRLHAEGFEHRLLDIDWRTQLDDHSLGWVSARRYGELVGFVNVAWYGGVHAFVLDTVVARSARRAGIGGVPGDQRRAHPALTPRATVRTSTPTPETGGVGGVRDGLPVTCRLHRHRLGVVAQLGAQPGHLRPWKTVGSIACVAMLDVAQQELQLFPVSPAGRGTPRADAA